MGLAETKKKQRIAVDPQNRHWKDDTGKFGYQMLKKMGWAEGQGLGRDLQGTAETLSLGSLKRDTVGLGEDLNKKEETYHQLTSFDALLQRINQSHSTSNDGLKEKTSKKKDKDKPKSKTMAITARVTHRKKFIASKRVGDYTPEQLREIFGSSIQ